MSSAALSSPDIRNLFIGKGIVSFKREGDNAFRDMGNAPTFEFTPDLETLDHFSSRSGTKTKDRSVVTSKSGTAHIVLEEFSPANMAIALLGTEAVDGDGNVVINVFDSNTVAGELKLTGTNEVGPKYEWHFLRVEFVPSAALGAISDDWGQIDLTGNVVSVGGAFGTVKLLANEGEEVSSD